MHSQFDVCAPCMVALRLTMCKQLLIVLTHVIHSNTRLYTDAQARKRLVVQGEEQIESAPPPPCRSHTAVAHPAPPAARRALPGPPARCGASRRPGGAPQPPPASVPPVCITADTFLLQRTARTLQGLCIHASTANIAYTQLMYFTCQGEGAGACLVAYQMHTKRSPADSCNDARTACEHYDTR